MKVKLITLVSAAAISTATAQTEVTSKSFFIGASYGIASEGEVDLIDFTGDDSLQGDGLFSLEFGNKVTYASGWNTILSLELLGSSSEAIAGVVTSPTTFDIYEQESTSIGVLLNGKVGYSLSDAFSVYLGAGIGVLTANIDFKNGEVVDFSDLAAPETIGYYADSDGSETVFAYQIQIGAEYKITPNVALFAQYRYLSGSDFDNVNFTAIDDSFVDLGARYYF